MFKTKIFLLIAVVLLPSLAFAQIPSFPMAFYGAVTLNGQPAQVGTVITAYADNAKVGQVTVEAAGIYGYTEPTKQKLLVKEEEGIITFTFQYPTVNGGVETAGTQLMSYPEFQSGETVEKNFEFTTSNTVVNSGGGGGGGSGGGSSNRAKNSNTNPVSQVLGASTTTDEVIMEDSELKIELQKKLIALLTQLILLLKARMI